MTTRDFYEQLWQSVPVGAVPEHFQRRCDFLLGHVSPGQRVLDLGCGEGCFAQVLVNAGARVVAADVAEEPLRRARAKVPGLDARLIAPVGPWPWEDASLDLVWAGEVIEHVADTSGWLSELRRVLRSGGTLLLTTPDLGPLSLMSLALRPRAFDAHFDPRSDHLRFYGLRTLRALLEDLGFTDVRVHRAGGPMGAHRLLLAEARRGRF